MRSKQRDSMIRSYLLKEPQSRLLGTIFLREGTKNNTVAGAVSETNF